VRDHRDAVVALDAAGAGSQDRCGAPAAGCLPGSLQEGHYAARSGEAAAGGGDPLQRRVGGLRAGRGRPAGGGRRPGHRARADRRVDRRADPARGHLGQERHDRRPGRRPGAPGRRPGLVDQVERPAPAGVGLHHPGPGGGHRPGPARAGSRRGLHPAAGLDPRGGAAGDCGPRQRDEHLRERRDHRAGGHRAQDRRGADLLVGPRPGAGADHRGRLQRHAAQGRGGLAGRGGRQGAQRRSGFGSAVVQQRGPGRRYGRRAPGGGGRGRGQALGPVARGGNPQGQAQVRDSGARGGRSHRHQPVAAAAAGVLVHPQHDRQEGSQRHPPGGRADPPQGQPDRGRHPPAAHRPGHLFLVRGAARSGPGEAAGQRRGLPRGARRRGRGADPRAGGLPDHPGPTTATGSTTSCWSAPRARRRPRWRFPWWF